MKKIIKKLGVGVIIAGIIFGMNMNFDFEVNAADSPTPSTTTSLTQAISSQPIMFEKTPAVQNYGNVNYSLVYNYEYYRSHNADLVAAFGDNEAAYLGHFVTFGMDEGRQACSQFNVHYYKGAYADLRIAFSDNTKAYYLHFINFGYGEGRIGAVTNYVQGASTEEVAVATKISSSLDISKVYNYEYYKQKYADLQLAFVNDMAAYKNHFITFGMAEGRQGSQEFNLAVYKQYADLMDAFGADNSQYYLHYINYGFGEGRIAK